MITKVIKYQTEDGKLFDDKLIAEQYWLTQLAITKANDFYNAGASLYHVLRYIPNLYNTGKGYYSGLIRNSEIFKLVKKDSLFWQYGSHVSVNCINYDESVTLFFRGVHNGVYDWLGGYTKDVHLTNVESLVEEHIKEKGLSSVKPAREHWYNRRC